MAEESPTCRITIIVIGAKSCGKTSLCTAYSLGYFNKKTEYTVSVFSIVKDVMWQGRSIQVEIRDTAGEERFKSLAPIFYRQADAVIVCYDITSKQSFDRIQYWSDNAAIPDDALYFLVGCKSDLLEKITVTVAMGKEAANTLSSTQAEVKFFETSAKTRQNVQELFHSVISSVMDKRGPDIIGRMVSVQTQEDNSMELTVVHSIRVQENDSETLTEKESSQKQNGQNKTICYKC